MKSLYVFFDRNRKFVIMFLFSLCIISIFYNDFPPIQQLSFLKWIFLPLLTLALIFSFKLNFVKRNKKNILIFGLIFILMLIARILFLINIEGIFNSDDAIIPIMTKHFLEGQPTSLFYYGQRYLGSGYFLLNLIFVLIMGYNPLAFGVGALFFVSLSVFIQFKTVSKYLGNIYSYYLVAFYLFASGLYSQSVLQIGTHYPLVFVFLSLIVYLTLEIFINKKNSLIPYLGFTVAMSYWIHQINLLFGIVPVLLILCLKPFREKITLLLYLFVGGLPLILFEITHSFINTRWILSGGGAKVSLKTKFNHLSRGIRQLFPNVLSNLFFYIFIVCLCIVFIFTIYKIFKKGFINRDTLVLIFTLSFMVLYLLSSFSSQYILRYFMPLYIVIPLIFISVGSYIGHNSGKIITGLFFSVLLVCGVIDNLELVNTYKKRAEINRVFVNNLQSTGNKYFFTRAYFESYLYDMLSKGKVHIVNGFLERYFLYKLELYNQDKSSFYVPVRQADRIKDNFNDYGIKFKYINGNRYTIFYDIKSRINYWDIPMRINGIGKIKLDNVKLNKMTFIKSDNLNADYKLNITLNTLNMPTFKDKVRLSGNKFHVIIPDIYSGKEVKLDVCMEFRGTFLPKTKASYSLKLDEWNKGNQRIFYLQGFFDSRRLIEGFTCGRGLCWRQKIRLPQGKLMEKESLIYIRSKRGVKGATLFLQNIIDLKRNIWWRPDIKQHVKIEFGGFSKDYVLKEGENKIELDFSHINSDQIVLRLESKYHFPYISKNFGYTLNGMLLRRLELH